MNKLFIIFLVLVKKIIKRYLNYIPNKDAYSEVYCVAFDAMKNIDFAIKELPSLIKDAEFQIEMYPDQDDNQRARDFSHLEGE